MTDDTPPSPPRNRRFLVSIWQKNMRPGSSVELAEHEHRLHGLVWEADPRDAGRITTPRPFAALSALPRIISDFLNSETKTREGAAPESEEGS